MMGSDQHRHPTCSNRTTDAKGVHALPVPLGLSNQTMHNSKHEPSHQLRLQRLAPLCSLTQTTGERPKTPTETGPDRPAGGRNVLMPEIAG